MHITIEATVTTAEREEIELRAKCKELRFRADPLADEWVVSVSGDGPLFALIDLIDLLE